MNGKSCGPPNSRAAGANLGGNSNHTESQWAGQAFLVRDRASVPAAKLLMFADYVMDGDVWVKFDIIGL